MKTLQKYRQAGKDITYLYRILYGKTGGTVPAGPSFRFTSITNPITRHTFPASQFHNNLLDGSQFLYSKNKSAFGPKPGSPEIITGKGRYLMHHPIQIGNLSITFLKSRHETHGTFDLFEITVPPQAQLFVSHLHRDYDETVIGMDGIVTWTVEGRQIQIGPGDQLHIPRGVAHSYANLHAITARMMCIFAPGLVGPEYFRELAAVATRSTGPADITADMGAIMTRYGVIPSAILPPTTEDLSVSPPRTQPPAQFPYNRIDS
jgi:quercetin dioxygenase-like cupin family protein